MKKSGLNIDLILNKVEESKGRFGKCNKFTGALTVELLKRYFADKGITTSAQNVYIEGIPIEIDLLIPKKDANPIYGLLYKPEDVRVVFEIKSSGSYGKQTINRIKKSFGDIKKGNKYIKCAYITLKERKGYLHSINDNNIENPAFTLFYYNNNEKTPIANNNDWERLERFLEDFVE